MEIVPLSAGRASRSWSEHALDVSAAAGQIGSASSRGFTPTVSGAASRFITAWVRQTTGLAKEAEGRATGLQTVITDYLATDHAVGSELLLLASYLREPR